MAVKLPTKLVTPPKAASKNQFEDHLGSGNTKAIKVVGLGNKPPPKTFSGSNGNVLVEQVSNIDAHPPKILANVSEEVAPAIATDGTSIYVGGSRTINMGNFESVKITVGITLPCNKTDLNESYEMASDWVSEKIMDATKELG
jgi:hypothetical protein